MKVELETKESSSAAVEADPLTNTQWIQLDLSPPPRPPAHSRCAPGYQDTGSLCPVTGNCFCSLSVSRLQLYLLVFKSTKYTLTHKPRISYRLFSCRSDIFNKQWRGIWSYEWWQLFHSAAWGIRLTTLLSHIDGKVKCECLLLFFFYLIENTSLCSTTRCSARFIRCLTASSKENIFIYIYFLYMSPIHSHLTIWFRLFCMSLTDVINWGRIIISNPCCTPRPKHSTPTETSNQTRIEKNTAINWCLVYRQRCTAHTKSSYGSVLLVIFWLIRHTYVSKTVT